MPGVTGGARADRAIGVRFSDVVALVAAFRDCGWSFALGECVRIAFHRARVKLFGGLDLLGREVSRTGDCCPRRRGVPAANKLIVLRFMALGAIGGRQMFGNHEAAMVERRLALHRLVAVEARDALLRMLTLQLISKSSQLKINETQKHSI